MIRGVPRRKVGSEVGVKIAITDDEGHEETVVLRMRVVSASAAVPVRPSLEMVSSLANPVEKEVATVLQAELSRYEKCGRRVGGLRGKGLCSAKNQWAMIYGCKLLLKLTSRHKPQEQGISIPCSSPVNSLFQFVLKTKFRQLNLRIPVTYPRRLRSRERNSLYFSLLAGNLWQRKVRRRLRPPPRSRGVASVPEEPLAIMPGKNETGRERDARSRSRRTTGARICSRKRRLCHRC